MGAIKPNGLYAAYLRKSRRDMEMEALGQGETLARHEKQLSNLADRLGIRVSRWYREIVSGDTIAERPQVRQLLEDVGAGLWDGVLVVDVDRLGRGDSIDQGVIMQTFLYAGVLIVTPDKTYDPTDDSDAEFFEIKLFFSRREYSMIKKRMQRGRLASALDGCYMGTRPVYGYERVKLQGRKGWSLKVVPEKAAIVQSVFNWYAYGMDGREVGAAVIADKLNGMGLRTDLGHRFEPSYIRHMLQNPAYIGKVQWNQRTTQYTIRDGKRVSSRPRNDDALLVDGHHEAIIDPDVFEMVQREIERRGKGKKYHSGVHAFSSKIKCGECGCWYGSKVWHSNSKYRKVIWRCNHKYDGDKTCRTPHLTDEEIQASFLKAVNKLLETKGEVIANGYAMIPVLFDTTALEAEHDELLQETQVVSDMVQQCIYENVHVALDKPNTRNSTTH